MFETVHTASYGEGGKGGRKGRDRGGEEEGERERERMMDVSSRISMATYSNYS